MATIIDLEKEQALGESCRLMAVLFYDPEEILGDQGGLDFAGFANVAGQIDALLGEECRAVERAAAGERLNDLRVDYAALFIGPGELLACPYGSVYLERGRRLYGETTREVEEIYAEAGLHPAKGDGVVADHIAVELEFLHHLFLSQAEGTASLPLARRNDFLFRYFLPFAGRLAKEIVVRARSRYYQGVGRMLDRLCALLAEAGCPGGKP
jgi:TorA maturation chaperone TorD